MIKYIAVLAVLLSGCATLYPAGTGVSETPATPITRCGSSWSNVDIDHAQALEDVLISALDTCTKDGAHYTPDMTCHDLKAWTFEVLPTSATKLDTATGRRWFPSPVPTSQLPPGEHNIKEAYGFTDCVKGYTSLADADWSNGAAATEMLHAIDRCTSYYDVWKGNGFRCAINAVSAKFKVAR